jgi:hypothetical protein
MGSLGSDMIDLIASGDRQKIECVLAATATGAAVSGIAAGLFFAPANVVPVAGQAFNAAAAGVGAVAGAVTSAAVGLKMCGAQSTSGSFDRLFSQGKAPADLVNRYEASTMAEYGLSPADARLLTKAAVIYNYEYGPADSQSLAATPSQRRHAVSVLLGKLKEVSA